MKKSVIILHSSCCASKSPIKERIEEIAKNQHIDLDIKELSDLADTMQYGTSEFPALVIDGKLASYRKNQSIEALTNLLVA